jgi:PAS domain S-box/diguanylate cyclase (GGDEF) domain
MRLLAERTSGASRPSQEAALRVLDGLAVAVVMIDESQNLVAFNRSASEMFGYEAAEVLGQPLDMLLPPDTAADHRHHVVAFGSETAATLPRSDGRTLTGRRRSGEVFPIEIAIAKTWVGGQRVFSAVIHDITGLRRDGATQAEAIDRFTAVLQHASDGVIIADSNGRISYASPYAESLLGVPKGGLLGANGAAFLHPDDIQANLALLAEAQATPGKSVRYEGRLRAGDGRWVWAEITRTNLFDDPRVGGFVTNFRDISEARAAAAQRDAIAAFGLWALRGASVRQLAHRATELVVEFLEADAAAVLEDVVGGGDEVLVQACLGWPQDFVGHAMPGPRKSPGGATLAEESSLVVADYATEPSFPGKETLATMGVRSSLRVPIAGDPGQWGVLSAMANQPDQFSPKDVAFMQAVANVLASALERSRAESELARQALHDHLTGLPNRALLTDRIELGLAACTRAPETSLVALLIDLDNFKRVNDTLGHTAGDDLLCEVARRLRDTVRAEDTVARFGGDEFVIVTEMHPHSESPLVLADRILAALRQPYALRGGELFVTASIGIAASSRECNSADSLLRDADAVMYEAKNLGRNRYAVFDTSLRTELMTRAELERDLHQALDRDELRVYYQPVVDSTSGKMVGSEALVRWAHPRRGLLLPGEFIRIAEDTGMILPIGRWVLQRACEQLAAWQRDHRQPDLGISVNLSPRQLADPDLLPSIRNALASTGIAPPTLRLEITETMIVDDLARAESTIESIAALGVGLVIDDFGTGYSSLTYLKNLPIVCIKIDRSFVTNVCDDSADQAIVAAVSELAHRLDICTVAEGVETPEQLAAVRGLGCTLIQGYLYAPALPAADLDAWLQARTRVTIR